MLDFKELPSDGNDFELLIRELLFKMGVRVYWSGKGPDGGRDLLCIEESKSVFMSTERRWLIQCKHTAHSEKAIGIGDLDEIVDSCMHHGATGYLLACSTYPSSAVVNRLENITRNRGDISATFWDSVTIERMLKTPQTWTIAQRFFPVSANTEGWQIYATETPNHWLVNYEGYYFHISNRIQSTVEMHLDSIRDRIAEIEMVNLPKNHLLRIRAIHYDDKNGNYIWYIDYLYPSNENPVVSPYHIKQTLGDGYVLDDGQFYNFDVHAYQYSGYSDHYDPDHYDFYVPFMREFLIGSERSPQYSMKLPGGEESRFNQEGIDETFRNEKFNKLVDALGEVEFIELIRAINSNVEEIDKFQYLFNWSDVIQALDIDPDLFFSARIIFASSNSEKLTSLIGRLPNDVERHFRLSKRIIFNHDGVCPVQSEEQLYDLVISIHPTSIRNKIDARKLLNAYFIDLLNEIRLFIEEEQVHNSRR